VIPAVGFPSGGINAESQDDRSLVEKMLVNEYCGEYFLHAMSQEKRQVQYEMEYILQGKTTDRENLEQTVAQIFQIRQGLNLIHIMKDTEKRNEARELAMVITGVTGLAPLADITACFIMVVWAMGEAVMDLKSLMAGEKVGLWKRKEDWKLSLEGLLSMGKERRCPEDNRKSGADNGLAYESYMKLLLLMEKDGTKQMRMVDMIQMNLQREEPGFSVTQCAYQVDIKANSVGKHVFFSLPIVENFLQGEKGYPLEAAAGKAY
jgi:hypothetical protein